MLTRALLAVALAAFALAVPATPAGRIAGPVTLAAPTPDALAGVRDQMQSWLAAQGYRGYTVSEVMAFAKNDYVAVAGPAGRPAFELLFYPALGRVMPEPQTMMWNTRYGMMGGGIAGPAMIGGQSGLFGDGAGKVGSLGQAAKVADRWLALTRPGERAETDGRAFPGYFTLDTTRGGKTYGMLSVNAATGVVWYHGWHGAFLAERGFPS